MQIIESKTIKSSFTVSFFTLLTGVFNYLSLVILAFGFGAGVEMDAFFAALTIPQIITALLLAILSTTFIPVFVEAMAREENNAWKVASISLNLIFVFLSSIAIIGIIFSTNVISKINPGFTKDTAILSASLFRYLLTSLIFSGTSIILTSLYHTQQRFFKPSLTQFLNSLITFLFVITLRSSLGVKSIAIGTLVGSIFQFFLLLPIFLKSKKYSFSFDFKRKEIIKLARLMFPLLIGAIFYKTNTLVERFIASKIGEGIISYLGYAYKIIMTLTIITSQGISAVLFPRMSQYSAIKDFEKLKEILSKAIRVLIIVTVPLVFLIIFANLDFVRLIFERGSFTALETKAVGNTLLAYLGFFIVVSISLPIVNTLYSLQETTKVAVVGMLSFVLYVFLAFFLSGYFSYLGIALAVSIQYIINMIFFIHFVSKKLNGFETRSIFVCTFKSLVSAGMVLLILLGINKFMEKLIKYPFDFLIQIVFGLALYVLFLVILRSEELRSVKVNIPFLNK